MSAWTKRGGDFLGLSSTKHADKKILEHLDRAFYALETGKAWRKTLYPGHSYNYCSDHVLIPKPETLPEPAPEHPSIKFDDGDSDFEVIHDLQEDTITIDGFTMTRAQVVELQAWLRTQFKITDKPEEPPAVEEPKRKTSSAAFDAIRAVIAR